MDDLKIRLGRCFRSVFPELGEADVERAGMNSLAAWDSMATVTLLAVIEEEFQIEFSTDETGLLTSFELVLEVLRSKTRGS